MSDPRRVIQPPARLSAWRVAHGEQKFSDADIKAINKNSLRARYERQDFVPSLDLDHIKPVLKELALTDQLGVAARLLETIEIVRNLSDGVKARSERLQRDT